MLTRKQQFLVIFLTFTLTISLWLGRTFPTHQYFSAQLGAGQLSLYNLLKAYSLLDTEVHTVIPTVAHFKACTVMIVVKFAITPFLNIFFLNSCAAQVGYCQGISFVAGVLLLHMGEEQAFDMLKFLMYDLGIRRQYRPDMVSLQVSGWNEQLILSQCPVFVFIMYCRNICKC